LLDDPSINWVNYLSLWV